MATMQSLILGSLAMLAIITAMFYVAGDWYQRMGIANPLGAVGDNAAGNATAAFQYTENWANQTSKALANAQAIPFFGGSFMLLTGVFQSITLLVGYPAGVILPLYNYVVLALPLPGWFVAFLFASIMVITMVALLHAMGGGGV